MLHIDTSILCKKYKENVFPDKNTIIIKEKIHQIYKKEKISDLSFEDRS